jgi:histidyl-tRNA synthetase
VEAPESESIDFFFAVGDGAPRERALELMAHLRASDRSCETDYAGRSLRGQLTQAARLGARITVVLGSDGATIRAQGAKDVEVPFDELEERLSA